MKWTPVDIIMLILASTVSLILIIIFIEVAMKDIAMTESNAKIVGGLIGSIISIIAMYIGGKIQQFKNKD